MPSIINSDDGVVSGTSGLKTTGGNDGLLNIQTNGSNALSINASQQVTFNNGANLPNTFGFKNRIINGGMAIDQRNAGASATPLNAQYTLDRWQFQLSQNSKFTVQQNAGSLTGTNLPAGFRNYLGITSTAATSIGAGDYFAFIQYIEGFNASDLDWGTSRAQTVTLSFWVRSSLTGTFGGSLFNSAFNRSYPFTYTISSANTWEQKSITIAGDTSGTWVGATNGIGMGVCFGFGVGSTYSGTAGSWAGAGLFSATGATSVVGTNGATFYITGVQLERGTAATSWDFRSIGTELALCQRYCQYAGSGAFGSFDGSTTTTIQITEKCVVPMRAAPSGAIFSGVSAAFRATGGDITNASPVLANFTSNASNSGGTSFWTQVTGFTGGTANTPVTGRNNQTPNGGNFIILTSEL